MTTVGARAMRSAGMSRGAQAAPAPVQQRVHEQNARVQDEHARHDASGGGNGVLGERGAPAPHALQSAPDPLSSQARLLLAQHHCEAQLYRVVKCIVLHCSLLFLTG